MEKTNPKKLQAILLRKEKKSYNEIALKLHVSKSTVSYWLKDIDWSQDIKKQLSERVEKISKARLEHLNNLKKRKWAKVYADATKEAKNEFEGLKENILFATGLSIYWGEGDKKFSNGRVRVSNIDERLLHTFNRFLQETCRIVAEKIQAYVLLYPDLDENKCIQYWSKNIGIDKNKFFKSSLIKGRHKTNRLQYGVCAVQVSDKRFKKKLLTWLELFSKEF
jgi:predicted transcriptional regulator